MGGVLPISVPQPLAYAIDKAGDKSDVDFDYLLNTAVRESSLDPTAKASTSSATGLFQFLDSTWLRVMKQEGPRLGYQKYADAIQEDANGDLYIADKSVRAEVLKLRENPQVAADLAAAFTASNGAYLKDKFGRMPSPGELYIAHFLGAQGAEKLFRAGLADPSQSAAALFPKQAKANPTIFYDHGQPRSVKAVYKLLVAKHDAVEPAADAKFLAQQMAAAPAVTDPGGKGPLIDPAGRGWAADEVPSRYGPGAVAFTSLFSNATEVPGRALISPDDEFVGAGLFTDLYGGTGQ